MILFSPCACNIKEQWLHNIELRKFLNCLEECTVKRAQGLAVPIVCSKMYKGNLFLVKDLLCFLLWLKQLWLFQAFKVVKKPFLSLHKISVTSAILQQRAGETLPKFIEMMIVFYHTKWNTVILLFLTWSFCATLIPPWISMYSWFICKCKWSVLGKNLKKWDCTSTVEYIFTINNANNRVLVRIENENLLF